MDQLDLSKVSEGDSILLRSGATIKVHKIYAHCGGFKVFYGPSDQEWFYWKKDGVFSITDLPKTPFDIVAVYANPFDWKDVKPGMAFQIHDQAPETETLIYIGPSFQSRDHAVFHSRRKKYDGSMIYSYESQVKNFLRRLPHKDEVMLACK